MVGMLCADHSSNMPAVTVTVSTGCPRGWLLWMICSPHRGCFHCRAMLCATSPPPSVTDEWGHAGKEPLAEALVLLISQLLSCEPGPELFWFMPSIQVKSPQSQLSATFRDLSLRQALLILRWSWNLWRRWDCSCWAWGPAGDVIAVPPAHRNSWGEAAGRFASLYHFSSAAGPIPKCLHVPPEPGEESKWAAPIQPVWSSAWWWFYWFRGGQAWSLYQGKKSSFHWVNKTLKMEPDETQL